MSKCEYLTSCLWGSRHNQTSKEGRGEWEELLLRLSRPDDAGHQQQRVPGVRQPRGCHVRDAARDHPQDPPAGTRGYIRCGTSGVCYWLPCISLILSHNTPSQVWLKIRVKFSLEVGLVLGHKWLECCLHSEILCMRPALEGKKPILLFAIHSCAAMVEQFGNSVKPGDVGVINSVRCDTAKGK